MQMVSLLLHTANRTKKNHPKSKGPTHLSNIGTDLAGLGQKLDSSHPFVRRESRLARKVVQVHYQALEYIFKPLIRVRRVDCDDIFGDVVDGEILQWR
jgi:predicted protein tyrosine phosphatase